MTSRASIASFAVAAACSFATAGALAQAPAPAPAHSPAAAAQAATTPTTTPVRSGATTTTAPSAISLPSYGLSLPLPQGYARDADTEKSVVVIVPAERVGRPLERGIMINQMPRQISFERAVEESVRDSVGLGVARKDATWGGLKATELLPGVAPSAAAPKPPPPAPPPTAAQPGRLRLPEPPTGPAAAGSRTGAAAAAAVKPQGVRVLRALMLEREGYVFLIGLVGVAFNEDDLRAYETVVAGTQWRKIERAADAIAVREPPFTLPAGGITFSIPDPFRSEPTKSRTSAVFVARDLPTRVVASRLTITLIPRPPAGAAPHTLADLKIEVNRTFGPQWRLTQPLTWSNAAGVIQTTITKPVQTADGWVQALLALTPDGRATLFSLQSRGVLEESGRLDQVLLIIRRSIVAAAP